MAAAQRIANTLAARAQLFKAISDGHKFCKSGKSQRAAAQFPWGSQCNEM